MRRALLARLSVLPVALALSLASPARGAESLRIGIAGAHTGDLASYGIPTRGAAELIAKEINDRGGVLGRKVELLVEDDQCKPEVAANVAAKLVSEKVDAVIGHICSGATKAALGTYREANIPVISPSATNPPLTQSGEYPNFFRTIASDDNQARLAVRFAIDKLKVTKVAVIHDKGDYGKGFAEFAKAFLEKEPRAKVALFEGITPGAVDYSAVVQKIKQSGAEAVIYGGYHPEASKIVGQMKRKGVKAAFISDDGVKDDTFIKVARKDAEGVYASGPKDVSKIPLAKKANDAYRKAYGAEPGAFYLQGYAGVLALLNAIQKSGSTKPEAVEAALRKEWVETPLGKIRFDKRGDAIGVDFSMYQVRGGKYVEVPTK